MTELKILYVEDDEQTRNDFSLSAERLSKAGEYQIQVELAASLEEALRKLDNSLDGAVIDMNLNGDAQAGARVVDHINGTNIRIPIAILTGTPDSVGEIKPNVKIYKKGEGEHDDIMSRFFAVHRCGLTKVMGARGKIEELLNKVFFENIVAQQDAWIGYGNLDAEKSEHALLRHTLNHLIHLVDLDDEHCFPEEFYISPPRDTQFRTGSIVARRADSKHFVVLNPLCDLTPRTPGGEYKASSILLASVDQLVDHLPTGERRAEEKRAELKKNNGGGKFHFLPDSQIFPGGLVNFESLSSVPKAEFVAQFGEPLHQIAPSFVKDIVARFSAFLGRQGQPELR
jgi:CheY-like chemotaxis protein